MLARALSAGLIRPERSLAELRRAAVGAGALVGAALAGRPPSPLNRPIGPHRRFASVEVDADRLAATARALGGTAHEVVLTVVAGALRAQHLRRRWPTQDLDLNASVPVAASDPLAGPPPAVPVVALPLDEADPLERWTLVRASVAASPAGSEALAGDTPLFHLQEGARRSAVRAFGNLPVVHVDGPAEAPALLGRPLVAIHPQIPLQRDGALSVAVMRCAGTVSFGLLGDYDLLPDLDVLAGELEAAVDELTAVAGAGADRPSRNGRAPGAARGRHADR